MLPVEWRNKATLNVLEIVDYISQENPQAAEKMRIAIYQAAEIIGEMPYANRVGRLRGTREKIVHPNYIIVYRVKTDKVEIVSVMHTRRNYPPLRR